jgi:hypothetical protein
MVVDHHRNQTVELGVVEYLRNLSTTAHHRGCDYFLDLPIVGQSRVRRMRGQRRKIVLVNCLFLVLRVDLAFVDFDVTDNTGSLQKKSVYQCHRG